MLEPAPRSENSPTTAIQRMLAALAPPASLFPAQRLLGIRFDEPVRPIDQFGVALQGIAGGPGPSIASQIAALVNGFSAGPSVSGRLAALAESFSPAPERPAAPIITITLADVQPPGYARRGVREDA